LQPDALVLGIDTSAAHCAVALIQGTHVLASRHDVMVKGQAEYLMPMIQDVLSDAQLSMQELDGIGVGIGPGNFTGVRIAVSAARGLAMALDIPVAGVSAFAALGEGQVSPAVGCIDARQSRVYVQLLNDDTNAATTVNLDDVGDAIASRDHILIGSAAKDVAQRLGMKHTPPAFSPAVAVARVASRTTDRDRIAPSPLYLRSADAAPSSDPAPMILA
jgi:tRNA threonylcarbamoyladenosine biosynthesis protein TsaB